MVFNLSGPRHALRERLLAGTELCTLCGRTISPVEPCGVCAPCRRDLSAETAVETIILDRIPCCVAGEYGGTAKTVLEVIKRGGNTRILPLFAATFLEPAVHTLGTHRGVTERKGFDGIVPVPASISGRRRRGFDQTRRLAELAGFPVYPFLRRRRGAQQKRLSREQRQLNAIHEYYLPERTHDAYVPGLRVIVVDDVITTGASLRRCIEILHERGIEPVGAVACLITR